MTYNNIESSICEHDMFVHVFRPLFLSAVLYSFQCMDLVHILLNMSLNISFLFMQMIFLYFSVHLFIANDTNGASYWLR